MSKILFDKYELVGTNGESLIYEPVSGKYINLLTLPESKIKELAEGKFQYLKVKDGVQEPKEVVAPAAGISKSWLGSLLLEDLKAFAPSVGVDPKGLKKDELIEEILKKSKGE
ncbi:hypothetical protein [Jiulongibacter sediminis]|uniref:hypothetical protein n=1 Tax=Jiulongibacter sediminis TaxID=1605367 RepID=UPI0026ECFCF3|nr:hypothetical protein [Jiulongibacter sediminis]